MISGFWRFSGFVGILSDFVSSYSTRQKAKIDRSYTFRLIKVKVGSLKMLGVAKAYLKRGKMGDSGGDLVTCFWNSESRFRLIEGRGYKQCFCFFD